MKMGNNLDKIMDILLFGMNMRKSFTLEKISIIRNKATICVVGDSRTGKTAIIKR